MSFNEECREGGTGAIRGRIRRGGEKLGRRSGPSVLPNALSPDFSSSQPQSFGLFVSSAMLP